MSIRVWSQLFETPILTMQSVIPAKLHCGLMQMSQIKAVLEK